MLIKSIYNKQFTTLLKPNSSNPRFYTENPMPGKRCRYGRRPAARPKICHVRTKLMRGTKTSFLASQKHRKNSEIVISSRKD
jgi:hypothetical protein